MGILDIFKPSPHIEEMQDQAAVKKQYKYWRLRIFLGMYVGYIFFYFTRKSYTFAMPALVTDLGFDKADLGILASVLYITYGVSKFCSGVMADRSNPRYFMATGLILTGVFNIFFGLSSSVLFFAIFWGLNGWFQGWGWPPCARLLTHWYSQKERGTWWGAWNTSHSVGGALIPLLTAGCIAYFGWRFALYIPGIIAIAAGLFVLNRLRDTPQSLGLPAIEKFKDDYPISKKASLEEKELTVKQILFEYVLNNKYIWMLAIAYFFVYAIRTAINDWTVFFLVEEKGYSLVTAGTCIFSFEIGGIFGSLAAGWASDKIFGGKRGPINVLFSLLVIGALIALWCLPSNAPFIAMSVLFILGFLIFGPQMLIGIVAAELSHKKAAATATGVTGLISYCGAAATGYPLGKLTQVWGWYGFCLVLGACALISALLLLPMWGIKVNPKYAKEEAAPEVPAAEPTPEV